MPELGDGTVLPSFLGVERTPREWSGHDFDNTRVRVGEVQNIIYPEDKGSRTKRFVEYDVLVQQRNGSRGVTKLYTNCLMANWFCGLADYSRFTLRFEQSHSNGTTRTGLGKGSKVLVACLNGESNHAYIVGGVRDQTDEKDKGIKDLGHHMIATFNGVTASIDKDGQFSLTYGGKTKIDGSVAESVQAANTGTVFQFTTDGTALLKPPKGFLVGQATDHVLLGESFRNAQQKKNSTLSAQFKAAQTALVTAATALNTAGTSQVVPVAGAVAAAPQLVAAGAALQLVAQALGQLGQAIQQFEQAAAQKNGFLSQNNKSD